MTTLETRKLGSQGPELTTIGFGSWAMGGAGWESSWGPQNDEESIQAVHVALDQGINWFDTAAVYGLGHSEEMVARALNNRTPRPYVFTKCERVWDANGKIGACLKARSIRRELPSQ